MWFEFITAGLLVAVGIGWLRTARRLASTTRDREDLAKSALAIEIERQMLELIAKGASLSEVLDTLTRAIERLSPESHCTIMLLDAEHRRYLSIASGPTLPPIYLQALTRLEIGPEVGACGSAAFRNETVVAEDIANDPRFASARDFILSHGFRSVWSQPIRDSRNTVLGTFAIYRDKVTVPRAEELRMTRVAAQLAGNAIERIRAESHLRETVERLRLAETVAHFGIWEGNFLNSTLKCSAGVAAMMERPPEPFELTLQEFHALVHPDDRQRLYESGRPENARAGTIQDEFRLMLPGGGIRWIRSQWCYEPGASPPTRASGAMIDITKEREEVAQTEQELARAEEATRAAHRSEKLEQDRNAILELVANNRPLETIVAAMADAIATHIPGSLCAIRIEDSNGSHISSYPGFPRDLVVALEQIGISSLRMTTTPAPLSEFSDDESWTQFIQAHSLRYHRYRAIPIMRGSRSTGVVLSLYAQSVPAEHGEQAILESWGRFASLAVERRGLYEQLSFRAQYDSLTSLLNRASLYDYLNAWIQADSTAHKPISMVYLDLDGFKGINDTHGHEAGDKVLQHVAARILESVRRTDVAARLGGDEFVVLLPNVGDVAEAARIADLMATAIAQPLAYGDGELRIRTSLGISIYRADGATTDSLLKAADAEMYRAKLERRKLIRNAGPSQGEAAAGGQKLGEGWIHQERVSTR
jgi:diguanylate cyclase (GGDEF)-like protein